jgi:hypothetical protein
MVKKTIRGLNGFIQVFLIPLPPMYRRNNTKIMIDDNHTSVDIELTPQQFRDLYIAVSSIYEELRIFKILE